MTLREIEELRLELDERFVPLEPMLTGMRLVEKPADGTAVEECQRVLGVRFPASFNAMITRYDFGRLTLGPIAFCNSGDYFEWLLQLNTRPEVVQCRMRNSHSCSVIVVANSDRYAILLETSSGTIAATKHCSGTYTDLLIARDFDYFIRGVGTTMLERNRGTPYTILARNIAIAVGAVDSDGISPFWLWLAE